MLCNDIKKLMLYKNCIFKTFKMMSVVSKMLTLKRITEYTQDDVVVSGLPCSPDSRILALANNTILLKWLTGIKVFGRMNTV